MCVVRVVLCCVCARACVRTCVCVCARICVCENDFSNRKLSDLVKILRDKFWHFDDLVERQKSVRSINVDKMWQFHTYPLPNLRYYVLCSLVLQRTRTFLQNLLIYFGTREVHFDKIVAQDTVVYKKMSFKTFFFVKNARGTI